MQLTDREHRVYRVPEYNVEALNTNVARLRRRADRLGTAPIVLTSCGTETETRQAQGGRPYDLVFHLFTVTGEAPKLPGFSLLALVEPVGEANLVTPLRDASAEDAPVLHTTYGTAALRCDHCRAARRRNTCYVIQRDGSPEHFMVGSTCVADFTGHKDPDAVLAAAELFGILRRVLFDAEEEREHGMRGGALRSIPLAYLLPWVAAEIRVHGWVSAKDARASGVASTAEVVWGRYTDPKFPSSWREEQLCPVEGDNQVANAAIEWGEALTPTSDYEWNLTVLVKAGSVERRHVGLAASIIRAHSLWQSRQVQRPQGSGHFGSVGGRSTYSLTLVSETPLEGQFGATHLLRFHDHQGRVAVWFSSKSAQELGLTIGVACELRATVKKHDNFRGTAQTVLTRGTVEASSSPRLPLQERRAS